MRTAPLSYDAIERIAAQTRGVVAPEVGLTEPLRGLRFFENLGLGNLCVRVGDRRFPVKPAARQLPKGCEAKSRFENGAFHIILDEFSTYTALERDDCRSLFTLFHEVGHVTLHYLLLMKLERIHQDEAALMRGSYSKHESYEDTEWQADAMAAALTMPAAGIALLREQYRQVDPALLMRTFGTSREASTVRMRVWNSHLRKLYDH